ncbi:MAG TPA: PepSY-associated TM helix domain-containing protein, partial [Pyrinomonadaceae bacterium]|nr:PepSY-associated TM helix domain-containing protein [Pyrinomonadaceae bacterium]
MKLFRKVIFWCHLVAGVAAGLIILMMCVTGVLLAYERQITYWADTRGYQVQPPSPAIARQGVETLLANVRAVRPGATAVTLRADPTAPAEVSFGREGNIFVNPYTG